MPGASALRRLAASIAVPLVAAGLVLTGCGPAMKRPEVDRQNLLKLRSASDERATATGEKIIVRLLQRTKADKVELHTLQRAMEQRFDTMERRFDAMEQRFDGLEQRFDGLARTAVTKSELESSAAETRRHFDVVAESIRAEMRLYADPIRSHTDQINQHETRITRLERRSN